MAAVGHISAPESKRYADPATELPVIRLTDPAFASGMTAQHLRQFSRRSDALLYWSEREGARQAYRLDLKAGDSKQLTDAAALDVRNLTLSVDERSIFYFDGPALYETALTSLKPRRVYAAEAGGPLTGLTVGSDGSLLFAEGPRILHATRQHVEPALTVEGGIDLLMARPRRSQILWRRGGAVWLANFDGSGRRQLKLEPGKNADLLWTPAGHTLIYLHIPDDAKQLISLREHSPDDGSDRLVAKTSQYASAFPNGDASVFAGASGSKASAYVLLLLRVTKRELALCEHRASNPAMVSPVFSPDSQSVFFVSDRHGKPAIYRVQVEKFVEETDDSAPVGRGASDALKP